MKLKTIPENDVEFLKERLKYKQRWYPVVLELCPQDIPSPPGDTPLKDEEAEQERLADIARRAENEKIEERIARLADEYGFDGNLFRDLIPPSFDEPVNIDRMVRQLEKEIEVIPKIIAAIEKANKATREAEMPSHYVSCIEISGIIRMRSDSIARSLRNAKYPVIKKAGKNYCDPEQAAVLFPKWKQYWKKQQEDE